MKNNKKLIFLSALMLSILALTACGNLSDENSVWNQRREIETTDTGESGNGDSMTFDPGVFEGIGTVRGYGGVMTVEVTIDDDGRISGIEVTNHGESPDWYNLAVPLLTENIIHSQSTDVDGVAGATYVSDAFIDAVKVALNQAGGTPIGGGESDSGNFSEGTFEGIGTVRGYGGVMTVEVTIDNDGRISGIEVTHHGESPDWYNMAVPLLTESIINSQSTDIDGIAGATYVSDAFIDAVRVALENAE